MEDITKYIGLLGFVPFLWFVFWIIPINAEVYKQIMMLITIWSFVMVGAYWGITTLGGLL